MAVIDPHSDAVVIRVVYDGPPLAGKTTSVRALAQGLGGTVATPREVGGRTLYFDWFDYTGGLFDGRRIRCQVITVPGQATLASRRRHLLESADVVVFVGDSDPHGQDAMRRYLEGLAAVLARIDGPPVGIVLQANKRDLHGAVPIDALRRHMGVLGGRVAITESVARDGTGVRETFVFAVRLALDRVRELMRGDGLRHERPRVDSAQDLLAELQAGEAGALDLAGSTALTHTALHALQPGAAAVSPSGADAPVAQPARNAVPGAAANHARGEARAADGRAAGHAPLAPQADLPSGMIWPPVHGRLILHEATARAPLLQRVASGDWSGVVEALWHLHSPVAAQFHSLQDGRLALVDWARMHAASVPVLSPDRCIVLCVDGAGGFRLWQIARRLPSLRDRLDAALQEGPDAIAACLLPIVDDFHVAAERFAKAACALPLTLRSIAHAESGPRFIGSMPGPREARPPSPSEQSIVWRSLSMQLEYARSEIRACRAQIAPLLSASGTRNDGSDAAPQFVRAFLDAAAA